VKPRDQGIPRVESGEVVPVPTDGHHFFNVDGFNELFTGGKVSVEGGDPHSGSARDILKGRVDALFGECLSRCGNEGVVVSLGIHTMRAPLLHQIRDRHSLSPYEIGCPQLCAGAYRVQS